MSHLQFGLWDGLRRSESGLDAANIYDRHLAVACLAEELGYRYYFFIEHQSEPYAEISAPSVYLAAVARETSRLRFGAMVNQLPFHHPILLAQDAATVDQISHGRLEFGIGYGTREHQFVRWGLSFEERRERGNEAMDVVLRAWTQETVSFEGRYWRFEEAIPYPKPVQRPHPPVWVGAHSTTSFAYAAENGFDVAQNIETDPVVAERFAYFRQAWRRAGHTGSQPRIMLVRHVHVAPTDEQARAEAEPYLIKGMHASSVRQIGETQVGWGRGEGESAEINEERRRRLELTRSYGHWIDNGLAVVGSPATVVRRLRQQQDLVGHNVFCAQHQINDMPGPWAERSSRLFASEVMPAFD